MKVLLEIQGWDLPLRLSLEVINVFFVTSDKQSQEKVDVLRAFGADVIVCPTDVEPDDPRSYYSVSKKLSEETENSWYVNQYDNLSNRMTHYESTGPENLGSN